MSASTTDRFELSIPGTPIPTARARRGRSGWYTPETTLEYRDRVQTAWMLAGRPSLGSASFALSAQFYRASRRPADIDNLLKGLIDALNGLAWGDDSQLVCLAGVHKLACGPGEDHTNLAVWVSRS